jgi:hypothetical protein
LNSVDLPTFGRPTIARVKLMENDFRPREARGSYIGQLSSLD